MPRIPVNGAVLRWALDDADVAVDEIAQITGRSAQTIEAWMAETEDSPNKGDLEKIAKRVGRSLQFFLLPAPPAATPNTIRFRAAIEGESVDPPAELGAVRKAGGAQKLARWAAEVNSSAAVSLPQPGSDPIEFATTMRDFLAWSYQDQVNATSKSAAYKGLRAAIERLGIVVLYIAAGRSNCRGFSLPDGLAPVITLNSAYNLASLKSFTLLHELAHLAAGTAAICHDPSSSEEKWCDDFASAFLLPEQHLRNYFEYKGWATVSVGEIDDRIRLISNRYNASWQAVAIRLRQLGLTDQTVVDKVFEASNEVIRGFSPDGGRTRPLIRLDEYGATFTRAVVTLRNTNQLSEFDARQQLNVNRAEFEQIKSLLLGAG
ncbi:ImmA/IrrE family metallo-endopeptidase [Rathayibacter sp. VKM Ac-2762]|uniref:ImmA/IrrE family metallo-endopeptidase n=1 Tax=Rathayibacter sp. VKM Ac-2762 TaxID=2609254 RepID=UPI00132F3FD4|nr:ImmA/IrrE family metallo-endopeptidase [Rathayibacter sp. VKM Ac-2762]QHF21655.1 ImmA/IrrE family metallo-endopeptidase [Rathayibacter sp. VKM Ac-2762]